MFSLISRSLPKNSFSTAKVSLRAEKPILISSFKAPLASRGSFARPYTTYSNGRNGEISQSYQEEQQEEEEEQLPLIESLERDLIDTEGSAELQVPESFRVSRDGDTVIVNIAQEGNNKIVTVSWNVNEGPNFSEFLAERQKKAEQDEREQRRQLREEQGQEGQENEENEENAEDDDQDLDEGEAKDIIVTVNIKNGSQSADFKCTVSKDATIFLDSIKIGDKVLDDIMSLSQNTIEKLFDYLVEHGVDENFGGFVQSYNVTRKIKKQLVVTKELVSFLKKE